MNLDFLDIQGHIKVQEKLKSIPDWRALITMRILGIPEYTRIYHLTWLNLPVGRDIYIIIYRRSTMK